MIQGHHFSLLQHETEKLRNDIEKMRSELRYIHQFEQLALTNHHSCAHLILWVLLCNPMVCDTGMRWTKSLLGSDWIWTLKGGKWRTVCQRLQKLLKFLFSLLWLIFYFTYRRTREELSNQSAETNNLTNKLDRVSMCLWFYDRNH